MIYVNTILYQFKYNVKQSSQSAQSLTFFYLRHFSHFQNYSIFGNSRENVKEYPFFNIFKFRNRIILFKAAIISLIGKILV